MRIRLVFLLGGLLVGLVPASARAQSQDCELLPGAREATRSTVAGREVVRISGPARLICPGEVVLRADSAVGSPSLGEFELIGNVFFQDSVKTLTSNWARYVRLDARLVARGDVVLTDRKSLSVVEGTELEYLPASEARAESEAIVQGRPHAIFHQRGDSRPAGEDSVPQPLEVDADLMRIYGETRFLALGQVELTRGETRGYAREGIFDQDGATMLLTGAARLVGEGYTLVGDQIEAVLDGDKLHEVIARREAELHADDLDLLAPELRVFFEAGEVHRLVAVREPAGEAADLASTLAAERSNEGDGMEKGASSPPARAEQPIVISRDFQLSADSIDALAPAQQLEVVIAIGAAYGVRASDSLDIGLPEAIAHDWLVGDTITGYFAREGVAPDEITPDVRVNDGGEPADQDPKPRTILQRLVAVGEEGRARSLYRMREKGKEADPPGANYLVANRIVLLMSNGEVSDVEADGPIKGMHLQPAGAIRKEAPTAGDLEEAKPAGVPPAGPR